METSLRDVIRPGTKRGLDFVIVDELRKRATAEKEVEVTIDNKYYGRCPRCGSSFDYDTSDDGRLVRCRCCNLPMRLKWIPEAEGG